MNDWYYPWDIRGSRWDAPAERARLRAKEKLAAFRAGYDRVSRKRKNKAARRARRRNRS